MVKSSAAPTRGQSSYDVPHCKFTGWYSSTTSPSPTRYSSNQRSPVQIHGPLQQDRHTQNSILPFCYSSVEPASREPCQRLFPWCLQDWDSGSSLHLDCECDVFNLFLNSKYGPSLTCPKLLLQCDDAYSLVMHFNRRRRRKRIKI